MKLHRNPVLATVIALALATTVAVPDAAAREKQPKQHEQTERKSDHANDRDKAAKRAARSDQARRERDAMRQAAQHREAEGRAAQHREAEVRTAQHREAQRRAAEHREAQRRDSVRRENAAIPTVRPSSRALEVRQREEAHARNARREAQREAERRAELARRDEARRVSSYERQRLIALQQQREREYRRYLDARRAAEWQRSQALQAQRRAQQYAYQQWYWQQQLARQARWSPRDYDRDPYFYAPVSYRYVRDGRAYAVNRYAADLLQQAVRDGYQMGVRAGNADRLDGWRSDWRNNFAYRDASYGYDGYYVDRDEYNYYFRQGFQRGYQDAYGNDYRYGRYDDGNDGLAMILASVLQSILGLQRY